MSPDDERCRANTPGTVWTVNALNEMVTTPTWTPTCDRRGNIASRTQGGYGEYCTWDDENQLVAAQTDTVTTPAASRWKVDFTYDGRQRLRVWRSHTWNTTAGAWASDSETRCLYDGMLVVQERNGSNVPQVHYTRGADLSGSLSGAGGIGGLLLRSSGYSAGSWGAQNAYHGDGNGNVTALVDGSGTLQAVYKYDPFGNTIASTGSLAAANTMRFSSKPVILTTGGNFGAVYYGYRFYDPANQRWQNRDPIEEKGGIIHYGFVGNSPTIFVDILGLDYSGGLTPIWPEKGEGAFGCGWRIKNEVWEQYGKNRPPSDPSARVAHCIAHCRIKRECTGGGATSWLGGFAKEVQDWAKKVTGGGGDGYDQGDMDANAKGRKCAKNMEKNCEGQCGDAMRSGELY